MKFGFRNCIFFALGRLITFEVGYGNIQQYARLQNEQNLRYIYEVIISPTGNMFCHIKRWPLTLVMFVYNNIGTSEFESELYTSYGANTGCYIYDERVRVHVIECLSRRSGS